MGGNKKMTVKIDELKKKLADAGFTKESLAGLDFRGKVEKLHFAGFTNEEISIATGKIKNTVRLAIESIGKEVKPTKQEIVEIDADVLAEATKLSGTTEKARLLIKAGYNNATIANVLEKKMPDIARIRSNMILEENALI